jgi:hypothetical protein
MQIPLFSLRWRLAALAFALAASLPGVTVAQESASGAPQELHFRDLFRLPVGRQGLEPTDTLRALDGHKVRMTGYMVAQDGAQAGRFFLTPVPLRMSEHADGDADDLPPNTVVVLMPPAEQSLALPHTPGRLQLTGTLRYGRHVLEDGRVAWLRLQLDPRHGSPRAL